MFTRTNNKPITLSLKHKYSKSHSTVKNKIAHVLVSFTTVRRRNDIFLLTPRRYTSCRFLPEIDKKIWYLRASNFRGARGILWYLSANWRPDKRSTSRRNDFYLRNKLKWAEINPDAVQQYRTVQSYLVAGYNRICLIVILKTRNFPDQTFRRLL